MLKTFWWLGRKIQGMEVRFNALQKWIKEYKV
jgi:hypothetical protein